MKTARFLRKSSLFTMLISLSSFCFGEESSPAAAGTVSSVSSSVFSAPVSDGKGVIAGTEWLHWTATQSNLDYAQTLNNLWLTHESDDSLKADGDGMRANLGYRFQNGIDVTGAYTLFSGKDGRSASALDAGESVLIEPLSYLEVPVNEIAASTELDVDIYDLEFGKWLSGESFRFRPFGGFRWAFLDQDAAVQYSYTGLSGNLVNNTLQDTSKFKGYGIRLGGEGEFDLFYGFAFFGEGALSVLQGSLNAAANEYDEVQGTIVNYANKTSKTVAGVDAGAGLSWTMGKFSVKGGYELSSFQNVSNINGTVSDLAFYGFFAGASWNHAF